MISKRVRNSGIAAALVVTFGIASARGPVRYEFEPDPLLALGARLDGKVWVVEAERYVARIALLDDASRRKWLRDQAGIEVDPFAASPHATGPAFLTFLLDIERRGDGALQFEPRSCPLANTQGELRNPLDVASIETAYRMQDRSIPPAYDSLRKVLLDSPMELDPGGRATGLLAYRTGNYNTRRLKLEVRMTTDAGDPLSFQVGYRRLKIKGEPEKR